MRYEAEDISMKQTLIDLKCQAKKFFITAYEGILIEK